MTDKQRAFLEAMLQKGSITKRREAAAAIARDMPRFDLSVLVTALEHGWEVAEIAYDAQLTDFSKDLDL
jgi:glycine cleavage system pyridoxal-binding protein P